MKQWIVLVAVLPILMLFFSQYCLDQKNHRMAAVFEEQVSVAVEKAKQEGCFNTEIQEELRQGLSESIGVDPKDIKIEASAVTQYRLSYFDESGGRGVIPYRISMPISQVMAGEKLFGISEEQNQMVLVEEGIAASERLP